MTQAETDILAEREKQRQKWGDEHDDEHTNPRALPLAAAYLATAALPGMPFASLDNAPNWVRNLQRNHGDRERIVIAAALLIAEVERIDRATLPRPEPGYRLHYSQCACKGAGLETGTCPDCGSIPF